MWHYAALACLLTPYNPPQWLYDMPEFQQAARDNAVLLELTDRYENMCCGPVPEFDCQRARLRELHGAPWLKDTELLPPEAFLRDALRLNRDYGCYLRKCEGQVASSRADQYLQLVKDTAHLDDIYDAALDVHRTNYSVYYRRKALIRLRVLLGDDNYYAGRWPAPIPLYAVQEVDR